MLRRSLLASLLEAAEKNARAESISMFEMGPIFEPVKGASRERAAQTGHSDDRTSQPDCLGCEGFATAGLLRPEGTHRPA